MHRFIHSCNHDVFQVACYSWTVTYNTIHQTLENTRSRWNSERQSSNFKQSFVCVDSKILEWFLLKSILLNVFRPASFAKISFTLGIGYLSICDAFIARYFVIATQSNSSITFLNCYNWCSSLGVLYRFPDSFSHVLIYCVLNTRFQWERNRSGSKEYGLYGIINRDFHWGTSEMTKTIRKQFGEFVSDIVQRVWWTNGEKIRPV